MPRDSNSQKVAAHNRWHRDRNLVSSLCAICRAENPNLGVEVMLEPDAPPVQILLPAPPKEIPPEEQWQRDRIYRLAALSRTIEEVAIGLGMSVAALSELTMTQFQCSWSLLSERAAVEVQLEIESQIYERARSGDFRFTMLYSKLKGLPGFYETVGNPRMLPPASVQRDLRSMSTEELLRRRDDLSKVIDRPRTFDRIGQISPTLELRATTTGERTPAPVALPVPSESDIVLGLSKSARQEKPIEKSPEPELKQEPPETKVPGPVIARPEAGLLCL